jgi:hypothetical protein
VASVVFGAVDVAAGPIGGFGPEDFTIPTPSIWMADVAIARAVRTFARGFFDTASDTVGAASSRQWTGARRRDLTAFRTASRARDEMWRAPINRERSGNGGKRLSGDQLASAGRHRAERD